jgi:SAM-dependent methyltransferase
VTAEPEVDPVIVAYYNEGRERGRLAAGPSQLERLRTQALLSRFLPAPPARVLDVGGAAGVYASWLAGRGYAVHLVDPVPLHVEQAREAAADSFTATLGDARELAEADASHDAVLLLGPLYHLLERADRVLALAQARRVARPGGVVVAAAISRYASFMDGFYLGFVDRPGFAAGMADTMRTGRHFNPRREQYMFTTAYFHDRDGLAAEVTDAGLSLEAIVPVEGPLAWAPGLEDRLADPAQRELILDSLAAIEHDPAITGASSHLLAIARALPLARALRLDGQRQEVGHGDQPEDPARQRPDAAAGLVVVDARVAGPE